MGVVRLPCRFLMASSGSEGEEWSQILTTHSHLSLPMGFSLVTADDSTGEGKWMSSGGMSSGRKGDMQKEKVNTSPITVPHTADSAYGQPLRSPNG